MFGRLGFLTREHYCGKAMQKTDQIFFILPRNRKIESQDSSYASAFDDDSDDAEDAGRFTQPHAATKMSASAASASASSASAASSETKPFSPSPLNHFRSIEIESPIMLWIEWNVAV